MAEACRLRLIVAYSWLIGGYISFNGAFYTYSMTGFLDSILREHENNLRLEVKPKGGVHVCNLNKWIQYSYPQRPSESYENYEDRIKLYSNFYKNNFDIFSGGIQSQDTITDDDDQWEPPLTEEDLVKQIHQDPYISLPGHKYAGPGNTLSAVTPIDADDHLAQQHDKDYQSAKSDSDIREADRHFIKDNIDLALKGDIHAGLNAAGIGLKYGVESLTGVLYKGTLHVVIFLLVPWVLNINLHGILLIKHILIIGLIKELIGNN